MAVDVITIQQSLDGFLGASASVIGEPFSSVGVRYKVAFLSREWSGVQGYWLHHFTAGLDGAHVQSLDEKETNDSDWYEFHLEQMMEDYRRSYERLAQMIHESHT